MMTSLNPLKLLMPVQMVKWLNVIFFPNPLVSKSYVWVITINMIIGKKIG